MNEYPFGTAVKVEDAYRTPAGTLYDPTTVIVKIQAPDRTETSYTYGVGADVVKDSTGKYHLWLLPTQVGRYGYRFKGAGPQAVANEKYFTVIGSIFTTP